MGPSIHSALSSAQKVSQRPRQRQRKRQSPLLARCHNSRHVFCSFLLSSILISWVYNRDISLTTTTTTTTSKLNIIYYKYIQLAWPCDEIVSLYQEKQLQWYDPTPDYNNLIHNFYSPSTTKSCIISNNHEQIYHEQRRSYLENIDIENLNLDYKYQDNNIDNIDYGSYESRFIATGSDAYTCRRVVPTTYSYIKPNCNIFHEQPIVCKVKVDDYSIDISTLHGFLNFSFASFHYQYYYDQLGGTGTKRQTMIMNSANQIDDGFIIKQSKDIESDSTLHHQMKETQYEAGIMASLSQSPYIVNIYGYCGTSTIQEYMSGGQISDRIIPGYLYNQKANTNTNEYSETAGFMEQSELDEIQTDDVYPMNQMDMNLTEKLHLAVDMASSIAELHGQPHGPICHGDIHPGQWLLNRYGQVKLNDFNMAKVLSVKQRYGTSNKRSTASTTTSNDGYCLLENCIRGGDHETIRSPEEFRCKGATEQLDTYTFGNILYSIMTGLWPYYQYGYEHRGFDNGLQGLKVIKMIMNYKELPYIDARYRNHSTIEAGFVRIMEQCWRLNWNERITIFEVVRQLKELKRRVARYG